MDCVAAAIDTSGIMSHPCQPTRTQVHAVQMYTGALFIRDPSLGAIYNLVLDAIQLLTFLRLFLPHFLRVVYHFL